MPTSKFQLLNPRVSPPAPPPAPLPEPLPFVSPNHAMIIALLQHAGLPDKDTAKQLDALGKKFEAELESLAGHSHTDARKEYKGLVRTALDKKSGDCPTFEQVQHRHSMIRRAVRERASAVSKQGCLLAATVLEAALQHLPKFRDRMLEAERAILPGVPLAKSPMQLLLDELPHTIKFHIENLRANTAPLTNPKNLLTLD